MRRLPRYSPSIPFIPYPWHFPRNRTYNIQGCGEGPGMALNRIDGAVISCQPTPCSLPPAPCPLHPSLVRLISTRECMPFAALPVTGRLEPQRRKGHKGFLSGTTIPGSRWREGRLARSRQASGRQIRQDHVFGEVFMRSPWSESAYRCGSLCLPFSCIFRAFRANNRIAEVCHVRTGHPGNPQQGLC